MFSSKCTSYKDGSQIKKDTAAPLLLEHTVHQTAVDESENISPGGDCANNK